MIKPYARDHGAEIGRFATWPLNAITDGAGVQVGHVTCHDDAGKNTPNFVKAFRL